MRGVIATQVTHVHSQELHTLNYCLFYLMVVVITDQSLYIKLFQDIQENMFHSLPA